MSLQELIIGNQNPINRQETSASWTLSSGNCAILEERHIAESSANRDCINKSKSSLSTFSKTDGNKADGMIHCVICRNITFSYLNSEVITAAAPRRTDSSQGIYTWGEGPKF